MGWGHDCWGPGDPAGAALGGSGATLRTLWPCLESDRCWGPPGRWSGRTPQHLSKPPHIAPSADTPRWQQQRTPQPPRHRQSQAHMDPLYLECAGGCRGGWQVFNSSPPAPWSRFRLAVRAVFPTCVPPPPFRPKSPAPASRQGSPSPGNPAQLISALGKYFLWQRFRCEAPGVPGRPPGSPRGSGRRLGSAEPVGRDGSGKDGTGGTTARGCEPVRRSTAWQPILGTAPAPLVSPTVSEVSCPHPNSVGREEGAEQGG